MTTSLQLSATTRQRLTLASALVATYDNLTQEELSMRYGVELAVQRPQTRGGVEQDTKQRKQQFQQKEWERAATEVAIKNITGLDIEALRDVTKDLATIAQRADELREEIRRRTLLTGAMLESIEGIESEDADEGRQMARTALSEVPTLTKHVMVLLAEAESIAEAIQYNGVSVIERPSIALDRIH